MGRGVSKFPSHLTLNQHRGVTRSTGAHDRNRTGDLVLTKDVLYRLSYMGLTSSSASNSNTTLERVVGIEPTSSAWKAEVLPLNYTRADGFRIRRHLHRRGSFLLNHQLVEGEGFEPSKA
jgi:hypothetical protein